VHKRHSCHDSAGRNPGNLTVTIAAILLDAELHLEFPDFRVAVGLKDAADYK